MAVSDSNVVQVGLKGGRDTMEQECNPIEIVEKRPVCVYILYACA